MIDKFAGSLDEAVADIRDGATIYVSGFGIAGQPLELLNALERQGAQDLTVICNNSGSGDEGLARLIRRGRVRKLIASFPRGAESHAFETAYSNRAIEYECVPQGTLAERIRAAGAGIGGFFTPTGYGTRLGDGKETRIFQGKGQVFEEALPADYALVQAKAADPWGNLIYDQAARNFGPIMCMGATKSIVQVGSRVALGELDPEVIVTPSIFVDVLVIAETALAGDRA
ncbi:3-oxoacid CoA-transferase subunit A [Paeniglutamicibacter sp. MACA_103]|uniref:3-oxoacid CoA-transferase subunit A n=1 Tax=Paeniglutamicibacter sp. MACA_103 TaxID=3377337 RepID=UPI00389474C4